MNNPIRLPHCMRLIVVLAVLMMSSVQSVCAFEDEGVQTALPALDTAALEKVEISLVTCEPYNQVYSLYGHTGLRINDPEHGIDALANWGIFELKQRFFVLRFTFGLTDYRMEIEPWQEFCERYRYYGCGIQEQVLNLKADEKMKLIAAVAENYKPENRYYRYNYFYDNCTTRARDIVEQSVDGKIVYNNTEEPKSFRHLIHEWNGGHLWARWGNDILLGVKADRKVTTRESQFLPYNLLHDFDKARIVSKGETDRKLVTATRWALPSAYVQSEPSFADTWLLRPESVAVAYLLVLIAVVCIERKRNVRLWQFDAFVLAVTGILGLVLLAMVFSQHPTVSVNFQILVFNPLSLLWLRPIIKNLRQRKPSPYLNYLALLTFIGVVLGLFFQRYAEGVGLLAIFLLETYMRRSGLSKDETKKETK